MQALASFGPLGLLAAPDGAWWATAGLAALALGGLAWTGRWAGQAGRRARLARSAALVGLCLWLALSPSWPLPVAIEAPTEALLLLDDSCSMQLPADASAASPSRYAAGRAALGQVADALAGSQSFVRPATATLAARRPWPNDLPAAACRPETDLLAALARHVHEGSTAVGAVWLASDGLEAGTGRWDEHAEAAARALGVPVHVVPLGEAMPDIAIVEVRHSDYAFVKTEVPIEVVVRSERLPKRPVSVSIWQGNERLAEQRVVLTGEQRVVLPVRFDQVGAHTLLVHVAPAPEERLLANNEWATSLEVLRDKTRVLHVLGAPSYDGRFVREALRRHANVDLVSFYILRTPTNEAVIAESELSLIPFPVAQLFTAELKNFDVLVLQNFDPRPFQMAPYLGHMAQAVEDGLGLVMVGGPHSFAAGGWHDTPVQRVLPADLHPTKSEPRGGRPALAERAMHHPLLAGLAHQGALAAPFAELPVVSVHPVGALLPGASTLLEVAPSLAPLLLAREVGRGRSVAWLTGESWRWGFAPPAAGDPRSLLTRLWRNILGYLTHDGDDGRLALLVDEPSLQSGQTLEVTARLLGPDHAPAAHVPVHLRATWVPSPAAPRRHTPPSPAPLASAETDASGLARLTVPLGEPGRLQLVAQADAGGSLEASRVLAVRPNAEQAGTSPAPAFLAALARATGGQVLGPRDLSSPSVLRASAPSGQSLPLPQPLWPRPALVLAVLALGWAHFAAARRHDFGDTRAVAAGRAARRPSWAWLAKAMRRGREDPHASP